MRLFVRADFPNIETAIERAEICSQLIWVASSALERAAISVREAPTCCAMACPPASPLRSKGLRRMRVARLRTVSSSIEKLVKLIIDAPRARDALATVSDQQDIRKLRRQARFAWLVPDIVAAVTEGRQPLDLTARSLLRSSTLALSWKS